MTLRLALGSRVDARPDDDLPRLWALWLPLAVLLFLSLSSQVAPDWYQHVIKTEEGALELGQAALTGAALLVALSALGPARRAPRWVLAWVMLAALCCLYVTGEELSWGQHLFGWQTPEYWGKINNQDETNLHNVSGWLDQKLRLLLGLGVGLGGILLPILALRSPGLRRGRLGIILPPLATLPVACMAIAVGAAWAYDDFVADVGLFDRFSEVQEFYFYGFVLLYLIVLRRRLRALPPRRAQAA